MEAESAQKENMQEFSHLIKVNSPPIESQKHEAHGSFNQNLLMHEMETEGRTRNFEFSDHLFCSIGQHLTFSQCLGQICEQLLTHARMPTQLYTKVLNWKIKEGILGSWLRLVMRLLIHQEKLLTSWEHLIKIALRLQ